MDPAPQRPEGSADESGRDSAISPRLAALVILYGVATLVALYLFTRAYQF